MTTIFLTASMSILFSPTNACLKGVHLATDNASISPSLSQTPTKAKERDRAAGIRTATGEYAS
jgi:hypothetical protein